MPQNLSPESLTQKAMMNDVTSNPDVQRIVGFQEGATPSCLFVSGRPMLPIASVAAYYPKAYVFLHDLMEALEDDQPHLKRNFPGGQYPAFTANFGPETVTLDHIDCSNAPELPCLITALGNYDPDLGGHLVIFNAGLVIRFPPGSTIDIVSSVVRHANTPIRTGERRYSITQYAGGGLVRWARLGFQPAGGLTNRERDALDGGHDARVAEILSRFSTLASLQSDRRDLLRHEERWRARDRQATSGTW
jgi:hypothetical protein